MTNKLVYALLAVLVVPSAFAASIDYTDVVIPTDPYTWEGQVPARILLIQDQQGWGFNSHVQIIVGCQIPYDIINSGQIAAHNFGPYDKIVTAGQQPDAYYAAIAANRTKFETFMNQGGCISFETANYGPGYPNESIVWPGGFGHTFAPANSVRIDDPSSCLMTNVSAAELQNWNYSAHGIHTNLPAGYVSAATTLDGSPAGSYTGFFPWGSGGAFVSSSPLEWGYGYGLSMNYPRNFDCCECGGGPIGTEERSWGAVKSLYR